MKRKLWVLFATIVAAVALAFGISACSPFVQLPTQPQPLGTPVVSISDEGIASWEPVVHAVGYSYLIDDAAEVSTTARNVQLEDGQTIQVKATGDGSLYLDSAYSAPATYHKEPVPELTQLATPVVSIDEEGLATWEAVPDASGYQYKLNGGEEKTLESDAELQVQLQDKDSIQVKAVGDGETYSDSEYSEAKAYTAPVKPQIIKIETPVVTIDGDGTAHWEAVAHASAYFYKIDGEDEIRTTKTSTKLQDGQTISVKACTEEEGFEDSDYSELVKYTAPVTPPQPTQLATPEVTIDEEGLATWAEVAHASGYKYKISGGEETTLVGAELQVQLEDKQSIEVKAVGDGETYSDSPYSAAKTYNAPAKPEPTQLAAPEVTIDEEGLATWTEVAHASGYKYKINGGEETTLVGAELQVQLEDKQSIEVKAVGDGETYSDSPYSAAKTYNAPAKPEPTQLATPEVTIDEEGLATWERVENATGYVCKVGGEEQEVQTELSIQLQSGDTLQVKAVSTDNEHFTESAYSDLQTYTKQPVEEKEKLLATFTLGDDHPGETEKLADGNPNVDADGEFLVSNPTYSETQGDYKLEITATADDKFYTDAFDNKGNGGFRLGSGSGNGNFTFTVPDDVKKVVFYVTAYKDKTTTVKINEKTFSIIDEKSVNGEYKRIEVEVPENHVITFATAGTGKNTYRCKINTIEFWGEAVPELTKLDAPTLNVDSHTGDVTWEKVAGATSYTYTIDGENEQTIEAEGELKVTLKNNQTISVIAKGDGTTYADSDPATQQYVHEHAYKTENNGWENNSDEGHYKKCIYCQEETEKIGHTYENGVCTECQYAHTDHKYSEEKPGECTVCHLKHTEHTYEDRNGKCHTCFAEHTGDDHVLATKTSSTHHWTECYVCGAKTAEIAHTHNTYGSDETQHWSVCECGATVPDTTKDHTYNNQNGKCDICEKEHANHDYGKSYISDDASGHHQVCTVCGNVSETVAHSTLQYTHDDDQHWQECPDCHWISGTKEGHTYNNEDQPDHCDQCGFDRNHVHQYTAWDSDDTYHWKYCPYHGDNKNFTDVKSLHQYDAAKGDGICTEENCKHAHTGHTFKQKNDKDNHWQECTTCYLKQSITAHTYDWKVSGEQHIHACTCGYQDVEGHAPNMQWVTTDPNNHWQKCEEAGCTVTTENEKAPHSFVCESISDEQHQEKCECGATHEAEKHTYKNGVCTNEKCGHEHETHAYKWVAEGTTHNHQCTVCEKIETSHTATPDTEAGLKHEDGDTHWYTCKGAEGCDLHVDETEHVGKPTEIEDDYENHKLVCECGKVTQETAPHTYGETYYQGESGHYQICSDCKHQSKEIEHTYKTTLVNDGEQGHHQVCEKCEYESEKTPHAYDKGTHKCDCGEVDPNVAKVEAAINSINAKLNALEKDTSREYDTNETVPVLFKELDLTDISDVTIEVTDDPEGAVTYASQKITVQNKYWKGVCVTITVKVTLGDVIQSTSKLVKLNNDLPDDATEKVFSISGLKGTTTELNIDGLGNVVAKLEGKGNTGQTNTSGNEWRMYQTSDHHSTLTFVSNTGASIHTVIIVYNLSKTGILIGYNAEQTVNDATQYPSGTVIILRDGMKFEVGNTGSATNGQVQIKSITVVYSGGKSQADIDKQNAQGILDGFNLETFANKTVKGLESIGTEVMLPTSEDHSATVEWSIVNEDAVSKYVTLKGNKLTINALPAKSESDQTVTLKVVVNVGGQEVEGEFQITLTAFDYETYLKGIIEKNVTGMPTDVIYDEVSSDFKFTVEAADNVKFSFSSEQDVLFDPDTPTDGGTITAMAGVTAGTKVTITVTATYGDIAWATASSEYEISVRYPNESEIKELLDAAFKDITIEGAQINETEEGHTLTLTQDDMYSVQFEGMDIEFSVVSGDNATLEVDTSEGIILITNAATEEGSPIDLTFTLKYTGNVDGGKVVSKDYTVKVTILSKESIPTDTEIAQMLTDALGKIKIPETLAEGTTDYQIEIPKIDNVTFTFISYEDGIITVDETTGKITVVGTAGQSTDINVTVTYNGPGAAEGGSTKDQDFTVTIIPNPEIELAKFTQQVFTDLFGQFENDDKGYTLDISLPEGVKVRYEFKPTGFISADGNTFTVTRGDVPQEVQIIVYVSYNDENEVNNDTAQIYVTVPAKVVEPVIKEATLSFASKAANRQSQSSDKQVWKQNGITFTNDKGTGIDIVDSENPVKCYAGSVITIEFTLPMKEILFACNSETYASDLEKSINPETHNNYKVNTNVKQLTITFTEAQSSITIDLTKQVRLDSITVTYEDKPLSPAEKIENALAEVPATLEITATGTAELPASTVDGVTFTWAIAEDSSLPEGVTLDGNGSLEVTELPTDADKEFTLTVTASCEGQQSEKQVKVTVKMKSAGPAATIIFGTSGDVFSSGDKEVSYVKDNFTFTNNKNTSGSWKTDDTNMLRLYQNSQFKITSTSSTFKKIVFTVSESKYASVLQTTINKGSTITTVKANVQINETDMTVTVEFTEGISDTGLYTLSAQTRVTKLEIYA